MQQIEARASKSFLAVGAWLLATGIATFPGGEALTTPAWARPDDAEIAASIERGAEFLKRIDRHTEGSHGLVCYALLHAGVPVDDPVVSRLLGHIKGKVRGGMYIPHAHHFYEASVDLMALEKADSTLYKPEIAAIALYIAKGQLGSGAWFYPDRRSTSGDTSITQYSVLGLWAAARAGVKVPTNTWDRMAAWLVSTQLADGSFTYHPPEIRAMSLHTMTVAGVACQYIAKQYLDPSKRPQEPATPPSEAAEKTPKETKRGPLYGVLEEVAVDAEEKQKEAPRRAVDLVIPSGPTQRTVDNAQIDESIARGLDWVARNYSASGRGIDWQQYYLYGLERMTALANLTEINGHDWYGEGAERLLMAQQEDGGWRGNHSPGVATAFCILFLSRATGHTLKGADPRQPTLGGGLLAGGRGLPENLAEVRVQSGEIKTEKLTGPVADLLAALENPQSTQVIDAQKALVEKIQVGSRDELIGQTERLLKLIEDPRIEVRRTAYWALGRTGDIRLVPKIIRGLDDISLDVAVEARNALCWISRRPNGFGAKDSPLDGLEDATEEAKQEGVARWREETKKYWLEWYASIRPYDERDDSLEPEESAAP